MMRLVIRNRAMSILIDDARHAIERASELAVEHASDVSIYTTIGWRGERRRCVAICRADGRFWQAADWDAP